MPSAAAEFIDAALRATGDEPLSYTHTHTDLKWLIRDHLLSLLGAFPSLSPHSATFTDGDGDAARLLHAHGLLPVSPDAPHVLLTIWLQRDYPLTPPLVFVFPAGADQPLLHDHPFVDAASGAVASPYLEEWAFPESNLAGLARDLVRVFGLCHPYAAVKRGPVMPTMKETIDCLLARLLDDAWAFRSQIEADVERLAKMQALLLDRARAIQSGLWELETEKQRLEEAVKRKAEDAHALCDWLELVRGVEATSLEGLEAVEEAGRRMLEEEAAAAAVDDVVYALDQALEAEVLDFASYMKQMKALARQQFFHRAWVSKIQRSSRLLLLLDKDLAGY
ncbi:protein ELC-like [Zingiber officinale]|uniref:Uncharacterized protein n=1 Tax=Zingiber officinale TaxID=94328 RepID=A0A8J5HI09_ZINOF|nr:protein ELC-like [Zingiber officinale]KAG6525041.1 hypothetical protein ZIOFF_014993 [Zingiber officinale]